MSDSVWSHRWQPTRLPCPWDSPSKNTGVGCHFLLQCMRVKSESEVTQLCPTLHDPLDCSLPGSSVYGIFQARVLEWGAIALSISLTSFSQHYWDEFLSKSYLQLQVCCVLSHSVMYDSLWPHGLYPARLLCPRDFPGKNFTSGLPFPPPGNLPELVSPASQADSWPLCHLGSFSTTRKARNACLWCFVFYGRRLVYNPNRRKKNGNSLTYRKRLRCWVHKDSLLTISTIS